MVAQTEFLTGQFKPAETVHTEWTIALHIGTLDDKLFVIERTATGGYEASVGGEFYDITEDEFRYWHAQVAA